jgi:predicted CopG family antitoxin
MARKLTITVDDDVYIGLKTRVGRRRISRFLNDLARPLVLEGGAAGRQSEERVEDLLAEAVDEGC